MVDKIEEQYLEKVLEIATKNLEQIKEKIGANASDLSRMNNYFWENYTEFDEYGYEMYDHKQAMQVGESWQKEYLKDMQRYEKMQENPYFGRVDFCYEGEDEPESYYIGIGNLAGGRAVLPLVYDWRAPVSGLFYDFDKGPASFEAPMGTLTGEITRKRQYKIRDGRLQYVVESDINIDDEILQMALSEHTDASLKSIVTTIQKEQNQIIRDKAHKILVVQGCAGSGKTSVALHRIAYLLYHNRDKLKAAQVLVLSPNSIFGDYISRILPELGEENICEMTLDDYAYRELQELGEAEDRYDELERALTGNARPEAIYRQTKDFVAELDQFILELEWEVVDIRDFSYGKVSKSSDEISRLFYEQFADVPIFERMERIAELVIDEEETLRGRDLEEEDRLDVIAKMNAMYEISDPKALYNHFLRETGREELPEESRVIPYEDVYPLLYFKYMTQKMPKHDRVRHLVIDEMQDYSYLQYRLLSLMFHCPMTILGDRMQTMGEKQRDVLKFLPKIFGKQVHCVEMTKSYRSTTEIMEYAKHFSENGTDAAESVERHGEMPQEQNFANRAAMWDAIAEQIQASGDLHTRAVICLNQEESAKAAEKLRARGVECTLLNKESMKFTPGISVLPFYLAKGLEFDGVFIPDVQAYTTPLHHQAMYINATRALHVLKLYQIAE